MAVNGFLKTLQQRQTKTAARFDHVVVVLEPMDKQRPNGDGYKENRKEVPSGHVGAAKILEDIMPHLPFSYHFAGADVEADRILAAYAAHARNLGHNSFILSSDKDLCQLVVDNAVAVIKPENWMIHREKHVWLRYKVKPQEIPVYLALDGDKSDNIAGIPGWGPVNAQKAAAHRHPDYDVRHLDQEHNMLLLQRSLTASPVPSRLKTMLLNSWGAFTENLRLTNLTNIAPEAWPTAAYNPAALRAAVLPHHDLRWLLHTQF